MAHIVAVGFAKVPEEFWIAAAEFPFLPSTHHLLLVRLGNCQWETSRVQRPVRFPQRSIGVRQQIPGFASGKRLSSSDEAGNCRFQAGKRTIQRLARKFAACWNAGRPVLDGGHYVNFQPSAGALRVFIVRSRNFHIGPYPTSHQRAIEVPTNCLSCFCQFNGVSIQNHEKEVYATSLTLTNHSEYRSSKEDER